MWCRALVTLAVGLLAACSPRRVAEQLALGRAVVRTDGVRYGDGPARRLDVYHPRAPRAGRPVVVFLYGGRWKYGSRRDYLALANALTRRGWVVVVPEYRKWPEAIFPAWVEDGAAAVRWTRDHVARFDGDSSRIFVIGHSAGAHTATLLALDERYLRDAGVGIDEVRGFVSIAGPVDTTWTARDVQRLMGPPAQWPSSYPATHVDGREPPLLLLHGARDAVVTVGNSTRLAARVRERGGCALARVYPGIGHVDIALAFAFPALQVAPVQRDVAAFMEDPVGLTCPAAASMR